MFEPAEILFLVSKGTPVRLFECGDYRALLVTKPGSGVVIQYLHFLVISRKSDSATPILLIAAEQNTHSQEMMKVAEKYFGNLPGDDAEDEAFLCVFDGSGRHFNYGASAKYVALEQFEEEALALMRKRLKLQEEVRLIRDFRTETSESEKNALIEKTANKNATPKDADALINDATDLIEIYGLNRSLLLKKLSAEHTNVRIDVIAHAVDSAISLCETLRNQKVSYKPATKQQLSPEGWRRKRNKKLANMVLWFCGLITTTLVNRYVVDNPVNEIAKLICWIGLWVNVFLATSASIQLRKSSAKAITNESIGVSENRSTNWKQYATWIVGICLVGYLIFLTRYQYIQAPFDNYRIDRWTGTKQWYNRENKKWED